MSKQPKSDPDKETRELRNLIMGEFLEQFEELRSTIDDKEKFSELLSDTLSDAILKANKKSKVSSESLIDSITPVVESAIQNSAQRDRQPLTDGLSPVIGPAIRKAINDAFRQMNETANHMAEYTFSPKAIKWRVQALFSDNSFGEIVMRNTIEYKVRQVFLIHRETGLLLHQITDGTSESEDADMVSSMLSAIQDFVKDSFNTDKGEHLETIEVGNLTVWIEQGARIASVIYGQAPDSYRNIQKDTLLRIQQNYAFELRNFEGDTDTFASAGPFLENCMVAKSKNEKRKRHIFRYVLLAIAILAGGYFLYQRIEENLRWKNFVANLENNTNIMVVKEERAGGTLSLKGVYQKQNISESQIFKILSSFGFNKNDVDLRLLSIADKFTDNSRDDYLDDELQKPGTVSYIIENDTLKLSGFASKDWIDRVQRDTNLKEAYSVKAIDVNDLMTKEELLLKDLKLKIEQQRIYFPIGESSIGSDQLSKLNDIVVDLNSIVALLKKMDMDAHIIVAGYTDATGSSDKINKKVSEARAESVKQFITNKGFPADLVKAEGRGVFPAYGHSGESEKQRHVRIELITQNNDD